jgi:uncharacterized radical SAM superfamily Fe-S cluster-containing enzyme
MLEMAGGREPEYPSGMIVELLDKCDIACPTCIAGSSPELTNLRMPGIVDRRIDAVQRRQRLDGVFLSGGEPTIHPQLFDFMSVVDSKNLSRKVLITNGLRLARDEDFRDDLLPRLADGWEVFLQFDVLDAEILKDIRGDDFVSDRIRAVEALGSYKIPTTLVSVAKRGISLERLDETITFAEARPWITGVQIQPIREAGRLDNYSSVDNTCLASDVVTLLTGWFPSIDLNPYPASPMSVTIAYASRTESGFDWTGRTRSMPEDLYLEPAREGLTGFRIVIMEYSDDHNWSSLRQELSPLCVLQSNGSTKRVDDHWDSVEIDLGPLRTA